jgi:hypothetical protein
MSSLFSQVSWSARRLVMGDQSVIWVRFRGASWWGLEVDDCRHVPVCLG